MKLVSILIALTLTIDWHWRNLTFLKTDSFERKKKVLRIDLSNYLNGIVLTIFS
jgi:hypothetical protein